MALAVLSAGPENPAVILERLSLSYETPVTFATNAGPLYALLYWRGGCVEAEVSIPGRMERYGNFLDIHGQTVVEDQFEASKGHRVSDVIALPFPCDGKIVDIRGLNKGGLSLTLETERLLINCDTGRIWKDEERSRSNSWQASTPGGEAPFRMKPSLRIV